MRISRLPAVFLFIAACLISIPNAHSTPLTLAWDPSPSTVSGYKLHYGTSNGVYPNSVDAGTRTTYTLDLSNPTLYIVATAYDDAGNESAPSNQVIAHSITSSAGTGGTISPRGTFYVGRGSEQTFTITASSGYRVQNVTVDGVSVGAVTSTNLSNISAPHDISVTFAVDSGSESFTITASAGANGSISPVGKVTVAEGANQTFRITPSPGYKLASLTVDGSSLTPATSYTFSKVTRNHSISAAFAPITHTITSSAGEHGSINPSGTVTVNQGANRHFAITADTGYHVKNVVVDGVSKGAISSYTFTTVEANHTIRASFESDVRILTDTDMVSIPEGQTGVVRVKLSQRPPSAVTVSVAWLKGDPDIGVISGNSLTFTPSKWNVYQPVTLAASPDADLVNGKATIRFSADWLASVRIHTVEKDASQCATLLTLPDVNANGTPELAVLKQNPTTGANHVYVKDGETGALVRKVVFREGLIPRGLAAIDDQGACNLAFLGKSQTTGAIRVYIKAALTGRLVNSFLLDGDYRPRAMVALPDVNGNGVSELAVLGTHTSTGQMEVQVLDAQTGNRINNVLFTKGLAPKGLTVLPDLDGNGKAELGVLGVNATSGGVSVEIRDSVKGTLLRRIPFSSAYAPRMLVTVPAVSGAGIPGVAVLQVDWTARKFLVQVKNARTGAMVRNTRFDDACTPRSLAALPSINENGASELALLSANDDLSRVMAEVKDAVSGALVKPVRFAAGQAPQSVTVLPDTDQNGAPDLAALMVYKNTGRMRIRIKDALTGRYLRTINIP